MPQGDSGIQGKDTSYTSNSSSWRQCGKCANKGIANDISGFCLQSVHFPICFWETIPPPLLLVVAQARQTPHLRQRWAHDQAWPIRMLHSSGHRDWHKVGHMAQVRPMGTFPRTLAGTARKMAHSKGVSKRIVVIQSCWQPSLSLTEGRLSENDIDTVLLISQDHLHSAIKPVS